MRIIHEVTPNCQVSGSVKPYQGKNITETDGFAEILMVFSSNFEGVPDETVYLEGSAQAMLNALKQAVNVLSTSLELARRDNEEIQGFPGL